MERDYRPAALRVLKGSAGEIVRFDHWLVHSRCVVDAAAMSLSIEAGANNNRRQSLTGCNRPSLTHFLTVCAETLSEVAVSCKVKSRSVLT